MAAFVFFFLPPTPQRARFLTNEEKDVAYARGVRQVGDKVNERIGMPDCGEMLVAIKDPKVGLSFFPGFGQCLPFRAELVDCAYEFLCERIILVDFSLFAHHIEGVSTNMCPARTPSTVD